MFNSEIRTGRYTSSEIYKLMTLNKAKTGMGVPGLTYIMEKEIERTIKRPIHKTTDARETQWGKLCELRVFQQLGTDYEDLHNETILAPGYEDIWCGSPDAKRHTTPHKRVADIKSPFTMKSWGVFHRYSQSIDLIRDKHPDGEKYYWQMVSNSYILDLDMAELIVYVPYKRELNDIREEGMQMGYRWLEWCSDDELPWLPDDCGLNNIVRIEFATRDAKLAMCNVMDQVQKAMFQS